MIMGWNSLGRATRLGRRLVVLSVAFSSAIACIITLAQLVADFRQQRADLDVVLEEVRLFLPPLAASATVPPPPTPAAYFPGACAPRSC